MIDQAVSLLSTITASLQQQGYSPMINNKKKILTAISLLTDGMYDVGRVVISVPRRLNSVTLK